MDIWCAAGSDLMDRDLKRTSYALIKIIRDSAEHFTPTLCVADGRWHHDMPEIRKGNRYEEEVLPAARHRYSACALPCHGGRTFNLEPQTPPPAQARGQTRLTKTRVWFDGNLAR